MKRVEKITAEKVVVSRGTSFGTYKEFGRLISMKVLLQKPIV